MPEADLVRQLGLYRRLAELAPYARDVWCTPLDAEAIIAHGRELGMIETIPHALGPIVRFTGDSAVLSAYYRNNILHVYALPSLIACAFLNNPAIRTEDVQRLAWRIYPYIAQELFLHWPEARLAAVVDEVLSTFEALGLLEPSVDRGVWRRPATGTTQAVQLSVRSRCCCGPGPGGSRRRPSRASASRWRAGCRCSTSCARPSSSIGPCSASSSTCCGSAT
jgi:glycerol-3-phosphate O-acyltransferase